MRDYLLALLPVYQFVSVPVHDGDKVVHEVFQVLSKAKPWTTPTYLKAGAVEHHKVSVQHYQRWIVVRENEEGRIPEALEVFPCDDPVDIEITSIVSVSDRQSVRRWSSQTSDVAGCLRLTNPCKLQSPALDGADVPVLELLDQCAVLGMEERDGPLFHEPRGEGAYDGRNLETAQFYLQAVLQREALFARGAQPFPSGLSQAYYKLLLQFPRRADPCLSARECRECLRVELGLPLPKAKGTTPAALPAPAAPLPVDDGSLSGDDGVPQDPLPLPPPPPVAVGAPGSPSRSSSSTSTSSSSSSSTDSDAPDPAAAGSGGVPAPPAVPLEVDGVEMRPKWHQNSGDGYIVVCPNPAHTNCEKYRKKDVDVDVHGPDAPRLYLGAWLARAFSQSEKTHKAYRPSRADVQKYKAERS